MDTTAIQKARLPFAPNSKLTRALFVSVVFFIAEFILVQYHEMWGDEIHSWAIARTSHTFGELLYNTRYEGHPKLWYVLLYVLQKFTSAIFCMQALHVTIAACTVFVVCYFSPFTLQQNILLSCGYFFAYEYSIISRNYAIEILLLFLCAGVYTQYKGRHLVLLSLLFFLLFETNVYGVIIGAPFYGYIIWSLYKTHALKRSPFFISVLIFLAGVFLSVMGMKPPPGSGVAPWVTDFTFLNFIHVLSTVFTSYVAIPKFSSHYWAMGFLYDLPQHIYIQAALGILILVVVAFLFADDKKILVLFYTVTIGILLFSYIKNFGWIRHHGHLYILFILCYWLYTSENTGGNKLNLWLRKYFVTTLLLLQVAGSVWANTADVKYTFSNDMAVAGYLKANSLDKLTLLGDGDYEVSGIAGLMDKNIYFIRTNSWGQWTLLDTNWGNFVKFGVDDLLNRTDSLTELKKSDCIAILTYPFRNDGFFEWTPLQAFQNSVMGEDYFVYRVNYKPMYPAGLCTKGLALESRGLALQAMRLFRKAIQLDHTYSEAYMDLADCYNNGLHNFPIALSTIDSALKYAPGDTKIIFDKGAILFNKGDAEQALGYFKRVAEINPAGQDASLCIARCYITLQQYDYAIVNLKKLIKFAPENAMAYHLLASCYKAKGDDAEAVIYSNMVRQTVQAGHLN